MLTLYYVRPQDWVPGLAGLNVVKPIMIIGILALLGRKRKPMGPKPWPAMGTPHEWVMLVYTLYILLTTPELAFTVSDLLPKVIAFYLALHSITSLDRLEKLLIWWRRSLIWVCVMGLGVVFGADFTGSQPATEHNQGRLALHHWMLDNANALGHTLITLLPLLYFGIVKDRPIRKGLGAVIPAAMACVCLWYTQSKGAFLVGGGLLVFSVLLGRPWWLKVSILAIAIGAGSTALSMLPRMNEMGRLRRDEGVVGRLMAWDMARTVTKSTLTGDGYVGFHANIKWEGKLIPKATHSAYVQVGGDLGLPGLFLYLSALCCGGRTMLFYHGFSRELDRARGALFTLLLGYMASGWMINRSYHLEFFLILAAIAAYQRLCQRELEARHQSVPVRTSGRIKKPHPLLVWGGWRWRRYGIIDAGAAMVAVQLVLGVWDYVLQSL